MSHNLNFNVNRNQYSMFSVGTAWHGLGQVVENAQTSKDAIILANLDFTVSKAPLFINTTPEEEDNIKIIETVNNYGLYRTDTNQCLTNNGKAVTSQYTPIQNIEGFDFIDSLIGKEAVITTAGALGVGEKIFITAKLNKSIIIGNDDVINQYLLIVLDHSGAGSVKIKFTPIRVVCENTLTSAHIEDNLFSIKHIGDVQDKLKIAQQILSNSIYTSNILKEQFDAMAKTKISDKALQEFIMDIYIGRESKDRLLKNNVNLLYTADPDLLKYAGVSTAIFNIMNSVLLSTSNGLGQNLETAKGTVFGAFNGVTHYYSRVKDFTNKEKRFNSMLMGDSAKKIKIAQQLALSYIS